MQGKNILSAILFLVALGVIGYFMYQQSDHAERKYWAERTEQARHVFDQTTCEQKIENITTDDLFYRMIDEKREGGFERVLSMNPDPYQFRPAEGFEEFYIDGKPLLWVSDTNDKSIIVSKEFFSDLHRVSLTNLRSGEPAVFIGEFHDPGFERLGPEQVLAFLLRSHIVDSFDHLEADVCIERSQEKDGIMDFFVVGVHAYCTSTCIEELYSLRFSFDLGRGAMFVEAL